MLCPCPLGDLGRRDTGIQLERDGRVAQVVRAPGSHAFPMVLAARMSQAGTGGG